jgi:hypothetical protein
VETARFGPLQGHSMQAAVALSQALRRNAKHEARLFKYLWSLLAHRWKWSEILRFAQNDIRYNGNHELGCD